MQSLGFCRFFCIRAYFLRSKLHITGMQANQSSPSSRFPASLLVLGSASALFAFVTLGFALGWFFFGQPKQQVPLAAAHSIGAPRALEAAPLAIIVNLKTPSTPTPIMVARVQPVVVDAPAQAPVQRSVERRVELVTQPTATRTAPRPARPIARIVATVAAPVQSTAGPAQAAQQPPAAPTVDDKGGSGQSGSSDRSGPRDSSRSGGSSGSSGNSGSGKGGKP
jgi:uncharacterized membrane protein YgcG